MVNTSYESYQEPCATGPYCLLSNGGKWGGGGGGGGEEGGGGGGRLWMSPGDTE